MEEIVEEKDAAYRNGDRESMRREKREKKERKKERKEEGKNKSAVEERKNLL